jgi:hypothetical protein
MTDRGRLFGDERGSIGFVVFLGEGRLTGGAKAAEKVGLGLLLDGVSAERRLDLDDDGTLGVKENGTGTVTLSLEPLVIGRWEASLEDGGRKTDDFGGCGGAGGCTADVLWAMD